MRIERNNKYISICEFEKGYSINAIDKRYIDIVTIGDKKHELAAPGAGDSYILSKDFSIISDYYLPFDFDKKEILLGEYIRELRKKEVEDFLFRNPFTLNLKLDNFRFNFCINKYISNNDPEWCRTSIKVCRGKKVYYKLIDDETLMVKELEYLIKQLWLYIRHENTVYEIKFTEPFLSVDFIKENGADDSDFSPYPGMMLNLRFFNKGYFDGNSLRLYFGIDECKSLLAYCELMEIINTKDKNK